MLPEGIAFPQLGFWVLHILAMVLVFIWGYRKGRETERQDRRDDEKKK